LESKKRKMAFEPPSILVFISSRPELECIVSNLTKLEIFRYLISEWSCTENECEELWQRFLKSFNISCIVYEETDYDDLIEICKHVPTRKKTLVNLIHLQIAKKQDIYFLTGEDELKERYQKI
jgi:hypothetical protein